MSERDRVTSPPPARAADADAGVAAGWDSTVGLGPSSAGAAQEWSVELPQSMDAPAYARLQVRNCLSGWSPEAVNDALVLTSELVSNALLHGAPEVEMTVRLDPTRLTVRITDQSEVRPDTDVSAPGREARGGRGLLIVDAIAAQWGVEPAPGGPGKTVWFSLDRG